MALSIENLVDVNVNVQGTSARQGKFGKALIAASGLFLPNRVIEISDQDGLNDISGVTDAQKRAANVYFSQDNQANRVYFANWRTAAGTGQVVATLAREDVAAGDYTLTINGQTETITVAAVGASATAAELQTAIRTVAEWAMFTVSEAANLITLQVAANEELSDYPSGSLAEALKIDSGSNPTATHGGPAETPSEFGAAVRVQTDDYHFVSTTEDISEANRTALAIWAQGASKEAYVEYTDVAALVANEVGSEIAKLFALGNRYNGTFYSDEFTDLGTAVVANMSGIDFNAPDSFRSVKFMVLNNVTPSNIDDIQAAELDRKRCNYYAQTGTDAIVSQGTSCDPRFYLDTTYFTDWLADEAQFSFAQLLIASQGKLSTDSDGINTLENMMDRVFSKGVINGFLAPRFVSARLAGVIRRTINKPSFDGFLSNGYLSYVPTSAQISDVDRASRLATVSGWATPKSPIHKIDISLNVIL